MTKEKPMIDNIKDYEMDIDVYNNIPSWQKLVIECRNETNYDYYKKSFWKKFKLFFYKNG